MKERISRLIDVKSIVTIFLTLVFGLQTFRGSVSAEQFQTVFTTIIAFYFGTQHAKKEGFS
ncbi:MAG: hypothetical protein K2J39_09850 [Ruminococcus sp.]|nr:hypothetical protein [Ruminococcus sp.]